MAQPVWVLSVDLQAKTATFVSGLGDAARKARSAFGDISDDAGRMGRGVGEGGQNVRAALGLIDNTIRGNHAAAMADLIREFQTSRLVMMALPFAATIGGIGAVAGIAFEVAAKIKEWREEQARLTAEQMKFGTAVNETLGSLDAKLLSAQQRADELRGNHLGALRAELALIDHTSMDDLVHTFDAVAKAADAVFATIKSHWYTFGIGAEGAKHALDDFQTKY